LIKVKRFLSEKNTGCGTAGYSAEGRKLDKGDTRKKREESLLAGACGAIYLLFLTQRRKGAEHAEGRKKGENK